MVKCLPKSDKLAQTLTKYDTLVEMGNAIPSDSVNLVKGSLASLNLHFYLTIFSLKLAFNLYMFILTYLFISKYFRIWKVCGIQASWDSWLRENAPAILMLLQKESSPFWRFWKASLPLRYVLASSPYWRGCHFCMRRYKVFVDYPTKHKALHIF